MVYVRILPVAVVGVLALTGFFGFTGWKEREIFSFHLPSTLDSFFQTETTDVPLTEEQPRLEFTEPSGRYPELLAKLQNIQHSLEAGRMGEFGQQRVVDHISTSVILAQESFAQGDTGHALHLLETAYSGWQTAMENLAGTAVVVHQESGQAWPEGGESLQTETNQLAGLKGDPAAVPTGENQVPVASVTGKKEITGRDNTELIIENPVQPDAEEKTTGLSNAVQEPLANTDGSVLPSSVPNNEIHLAIQQEEAFELSMSVAREAYESGDVDRAESAIASAEILRPDLDEVQHWKKRIQQLPLLVQAQNDAENARNAGQLQDEREALMRILALTPENSAAAKRADEITLQINDQKFKRLIGKGYEAIGHGDSAAAGTALAEARKLRPSSVELPKLQQQISDLDRRQAITQHLDAARQESAQDNWSRALSYYRRVLTLDSTHPEASEGQGLATAILTAQQGLNDFLAHPDRLSSPNIAAAAHAAVEAAKVWRTSSPRLDTAIDVLEDSVAKWQTPVPVRVLSDNETDIHIRGVGKIGKTTERIIEILPGKYLFEGKRKNFRSVLVEVHITSDQTTLAEVTVICHERS